MLMKIIISILAIIQIVGTIEWTHSRWLDDDDQKFMLKWNFDDDKKIITFLFEVKTTGYIGFGLSPDGRMKNSDLVIGWVSNKGKTYFHDYFAYDNSLPQMDESQDWHLIESFQNSTHTAFQFYRKYNTCDIKNDLEINSEWTDNLIYSYGDKDPEYIDDIEKHILKGTKRVYLIDYSVNVNQKYPDLEYFDFTVKNYSKKITRGNERLLHHMIVFNCGHPDINQLEKYLNDVSFDCSEVEKMPLDLHYCLRINIAWAVGAKPFKIPPQAGFALGSDEETTYFMIQAHYYNSGKESNKIDSSGFRVYHTSILRPNELSVLTIGSVNNYGLIIPPSQSQFTIVGHCSSECLGEMLPKTGIKIISRFPHTHAAGVSAKIRHFRGNKELPYVSNDKRYTFLFQQYRAFKEPVSFLPGDQLSTECTYDTRSTNQTILGGESALNEMCTSAILYYPRIKKYSQMCLSGLSKSTIMKISDFKGIEGFGSLTDPIIRLSGGKKNISFIKYMSEKTDWSPETQNLFRYNKQRQTCYWIKAGHDNENEKYVSYPRNLVQYFNTKNDNECQKNVL